MVASDPQNYTVTFSDGTIKRTNPDGSFVRMKLCRKTISNIKLNHRFRMTYHLFYWPPKVHLPISNTWPKQRCHSVSHDMIIWYIINYGEICTYAKYLLCCFAQYKWEIKELADEQPKWLQISGNILRIPPKSLQSGGLYHITVSLLQANDSKIIIFVSIYIPN